VTDRVLRAVEKIAEHNPHLPILADSRRGLARFPKVILKMNVTELAAITGATGELGAAKASQAAFGLAKTSGQYVFVTMAEQGIVGASASGEIAHVPALPLRGEIDIVGAGDAVSANLCVALASGATLREALELANAAASVVIHKLGTTGTARVAEMGELLA